MSDLVETIASAVRSSSPACLPTGARRDSYAICGLRSLPTVVRLLVLDQNLRQHIGGFRDIELAGSPDSP